MLEYDLFVESGNAADVYSLLAVSPAGVAQSRVTLALGDPDFAAAAVRVAGKEKSVAIREAFGGQLFAALFHGDLLANWAKLEADPAGVRLRLVLGPTEVSRLPWELLHDGHNFLATDARLALSRYIPVPEPRLTPVVARLSVLLATASPQSPGLSPIPAAEVQELEDAIGAAADVTVLRHCTAVTLADAIASSEFHVVHYLGHGAPGALLLEDANGQPAPLIDRALGQMLFGQAARLVVLSACSSAQANGGVFAGVGPALIRTRVPAVVAMQYEFVQLSTAQTFNRRFYAELAKGTPVDLAVNRARSEISATADLLAQRDWSTPVLYLGTRNGRLITLRSDVADGVGQAAQAVHAVVAQDDAAAAGWRELLQTFEGLNQSYRALATLTRLRNQVRETRDGFEPIVRLADVSEITGTEFQQIKSEWNRLSANVLPRLREQVATLGDQALKGALALVVQQADAVASAIDRVALVDLRREILKLRVLLDAQDAALASLADERIGDLVAASERTLGRLAADA